MKSEPLAAVYRPSEIRVTPDIVFCNKRTNSATKYFYFAVSKGKITGLRNFARETEFTKTLREKYNCSSTNEFFFCQCEMTQNATRLDIIKYYYDTVGLKHFVEYNAHEIDTAVLRCRFQGVNCSFQDFKPIIHNDFTFNCFKFAPRESVVNKTKLLGNGYQDLDLVIYTDSIVPTKMPLGNISTALNTCSGSQSTLLSPSGKVDSFIAEGVLLYLGDRNEVLLEAGKHSLVTWDATVIEKLNTLRNPCNEDIRVETVYNPLTEKKDYLRKDRQGCLKTLAQEVINKKCKCYGVIFPLPYKIFQNRSNLNLLCYNDERLGHFDNLKSLTSCLEEAETEFEFNTKKDECLESCSQVRYNLETSSADWPSRVSGNDTLRDIFQEYYSLMKTERNWNLTLVKDMAISMGVVEEEATYPVTDIDYLVRKNLIRLTIKSRTEKVDVVSEVTAYNLADFFSDLGGLLGLYLGASLLTIGEIVQLLAELTRWFLYIRQKGVASMDENTM